MELLIHALVVLHLIGMAGILAGWLALTLAAAKGLKVLAWSARIQLLTGLLLVGLHEMAREPVDYAKITVKLLIALAVVACAEIASVRSRRGEQHPALTNVAAGLTVLNVLIAVLWSGS